jgi:hypothetical protein
MAPAPGFAITFCTLTTPPIPLLRPFPSPLVMILGGGPGNELRPLTDTRAEPAMPFAGLYRLIDVPVSSCINSGERRARACVRAYRGSGGARGGRAAGQAPRRARAPPCLQRNRGALS